MKASLCSQKPESRDGTVAGRSLWLLALVLAFAAVPEFSWAQSSTPFDLPIVTQIGCALVDWMTGPLAIVIFLVVVIGTLVVGIFAKMDWTRILTVIIIFGVIQGLVAGTFKLNLTNKPQVCQNIKMFQ
jgi:type IV secretory pathway VirB2 component (pilin)